MEEIVVIGSSNTDLVIKTQRIPEPGETVLGGVFMMTAGGKGANQAVAASRLGAARLSWLVWVRICSGRSRSRIMRRTI